MFQKGRELSHQSNTIYLSETLGMLAVTLFSLDFTTTILCSCYKHHLRNEDRDLQRTSQLLWDWSRTPRIIHALPFPLSEKD